MVRLLPPDRSVDLVWVKALKGHSGVPGNDKADKLAATAAEKKSSGYTSMAFVKARISERFRIAKSNWNDDPANHGKESIPRPPPKKSCLDKARNGLARVASQIRTGHWRSAVFLHDIKKHPDDGRRMSKSHVLLHCPNSKLATARFTA
jgi:hypothetical protein